MKHEEISFIDAAAIPDAGSIVHGVTHQIELKTGQTGPLLGTGGGRGLMTAHIGMVHQLAVLGLAGVSKKEMMDSVGATFIESGNGAVDQVRQIARRACP